MNSCKQTDQTISVRSHGIGRFAEWAPDTRDGGDVGQERSYRYFPQYLYVSERKVMVAEGVHALDRLARIFEASVATGNPVVWV